MHVRAPCACLVSMEARRGYRSPGNGVLDGCELPCGFRELNLGAPQEQWALLIAEPSPHSYSLVILHSFLYSLQ